MNPTPYLLECCVDSVESALAAVSGGADRLELCGDLVVGGTTPSLALFEQVRERVDIPIRVLLRPRFGDFLYTAYEYKVLAREAELFGKAGAAGIVVGCLTEDGSLHMGRMEELVGLARENGMKVTLHRAFDLCADPMEAYRSACHLQVDTILTSGQEKDCLTGLPLLKRLDGLQQETGGPRIMAGAGVNPDRIRLFLAQTGIGCYHMSARKEVDSGMRYRREGVPMGLPSLSEYTIYRTDKDTVAQARRILDEYGYNGPKR